MAGYEWVSFTTDYGDGDGFAAVCRELCLEFPGARSGDGTNMVDDFLPSHPDAIVADRECPSPLVHFDRDFQWSAAGDHNIEGSIHVWRSALTPR